ncbi:hypothetical protein [Kitasatospora sp. HPMI-4]|uniref:hypothetical protein n=1 Tax=Kitasatospora sp. HPMI-4 TaxID=3448443 RepID=UPI003F1C6945
MRRSTPPAALALAGLAVLGSALPAAAHGDSIHFQITAQVDGHSRATAGYDNDGDPVDEPVTGTLSAVASDGRTVGPWQLVAVAGAPATYTTAQALPPGHWKVTVESAFPDIGHGEAEVDVTAVPEGAAPATTAPATTAPATTAPATTAAATGQATAGPVSAPTLGPGGSAPSRPAPSQAAQAPAHPKTDGSRPVIAAAVAAAVAIAAAAFYRRQRPAPVRRDR